MSTLSLSPVHPFLAFTCLTGLLASLFSSGCVMGLDYERPEVDTPGAFQNSDLTTAPPMGGWRNLFQIQELDRLLSQAEENNHTLRAAWQSVLASRATLRRFRSEALPQVDAGLRAEYFNNSEALVFRQGDSGERYEADLQVNWELDLFGRIRRSVQAADATADAQEALYLDLLFTLQADIAQHYFQINSLQAEIELLERSRQTRQESLELIQQRFRTGTVSELAVAQTTSLLANAESRLFATVRVQTSLIYSLAALLGETPSTFSFERFKHF